LRKKKRQEDYIEVARANLEAWNQHAIYWRARKSKIAKRRMELKGCSICRHGNVVCDQSIDIEEIISRGH